MTQLDKVIEQKLLKDIENLVDPLLETKIPIGKSITDRPYFLRPFIAQKITNKNLEYRTTIHKIKLNYYRRNLALLEILSEKQNLPNNLRLVFKIVRENLSLKNIAPDINIYRLYHTYRTKHITKYPPKEFLLYELEKYYQIYKLISTLNLE